MLKFCLPNFSFTSSKRVSMTTDSILIHCSSLIDTVSKPGFIQSQSRVLRELERCKYGLMVLSRKREFADQPSWSDWQGRSSYGSLSDLSDWTDDDQLSGRRTYGRKNNLVRRRIPYGRSELRQSYRGKLVQNVTEAPDPQWPCRLFRTVPIRFPYLIL